MSADSQALIAELGRSIRALSYEAECVQRAAVLIMRRTAIEEQDAIGLLYLMRRATLHLDSAAWQVVARAMCRALRIDWQEVLKASRRVEQSPPQ